MPIHPSISPRIALKIDVITHRAALTGMPHLVDILRRNRAAASFLCPPRLLGHMGAATEAGCEVGLLAAEPRPWWSRLGSETPQAYEARLRKAQADFIAALGTAPQLHAAADWKLYQHGLRLTQRLGFAYASDCRGRHPYVPVWNGEIVRCPQFPTTLPTIDELAERGRPDLTAVRTQLLALTAKPAPNGHVFSLRPPHPPGKLDEFLEQLFAGWREQGYELCSIQGLASAFDMDKLPRHEVVVGTVPGHSGSLLMQGNEFLSEWRQAA